MGSLKPDSRSDRLQELLLASATVIQLHDVAIYGARHKEVEVLRLLEKLGSNRSRSFRRRDLQQAVQEVEAIAGVRAETFKLELSQEEIELLKKSLRHLLRSVRKTPALARQQGVIALAAAFEGFVSDVIRDIFDRQPAILKSRKTTLKDEELIDALHSGDPLEILKDRRLRDVMYGSALDWQRFMTESLGMELEFQETLCQMFLVRNAIVHSNGRVTKELAAFGRSRFRHIGGSLNVTERDVRSYKGAVDQAGIGVWRERSRKFASDQRSP